MLLVPNSTRLSNLLILLGLIVGILVVSFPIAGCCSIRANAPELKPPLRPDLISLSSEEWKTIPPATREILTENQELIYKYVEQLELLLLAYEDWRTSKH